MPPTTWCSTPTDGSTSPIPVTLATRRENSNTEPSTESVPTAPSPRLLITSKSPTESLLALTRKHFTSSTTTTARTRSAPATKSRLTER